MTDITSLVHAMRVSNADEVYNLAAQSFVGTSWEQPLTTAEIDALGVTNMLEAIRIVKPTARFYRHPRVKCLEKCRKCRRLKKLRSIREAHMLLQRYMDFGLPKTIVRVRFICL